MYGEGDVRYRVMNVAEPSDVVMARTTAAVLRVLAGADTAFSVRQAALIAGVSAPRALEIVDHAAARGLVLVEQAGRSRMCRLNRDHIAADAIVALVTLRQRMLATLTADIGGWAIEPLHASLFGSAARGDGGPDSDLDVLVVRGDDTPEAAWQEQMYASGQRLERRIGNRVSWFDISRADLDRAVAQEEAVIADWREDGIHLAGQPLRALLRRRTA